MLKNISRKAKSLLHDGPLSNEVEMKYVSENRQRMMEIVQGQNHKITRASRTGTDTHFVNRLISKADRCGEICSWNNRPRLLCNIPDKISNRQLIVNA